MICDFGSSSIRKTSLLTLPARLLLYAPMANQADCPLIAASGATGELCLTTVMALKFQEDLIIKATLIHHCLNLSGP